MSETLAQALRGIDVEARLGAEGRGLIRYHVATDPAWHRMADALDALLAPPPGVGRARLAEMGDRVLLSMVTGYREHLVDVLTRIDDRMGRILEDIDVVRHGAGPGGAARSAEVRGRDLQELSDAFDDLRTFQQHVSRELGERHGATTGLLQQDLAEALDAPLRGPRAPARPRTALMPDGRVDLNAASALDLQTHLGIDAATADALVRRRERFGPYYSMDELADLPGMNDAAMARMREQGSFGPEVERQRSILGETRGRTGPGAETGDSTVLRASLLEAGSPPPGPGYHAHHIVPSHEGGAILDEIREALMEAEGTSHLNVADNGVWLIGQSRMENPSGGLPHTTYLHAGNRMDYIHTIHERLAGKTGQELLDEVHRIGRELESGTFRFLTAPRGRARPRFTVDNPLAINGAEIGDLQGLPGIGPTLAERIHAYGATHGPFSSADDLLGVDGIGPETVAQLRDLLTF